MAGVWCNNIGIKKSAWCRSSRVAFLMIRRAARLPTSLSKWACEQSENDKSDDVTYAVAISRQMSLRLTILKRKQASG